MSTRRAPICLLGYNRADHFQQTLEALLQNPLAKESDLYIFLDGPLSEADAQQSGLVAGFVSSPRVQSGFKSVKLNKGEVNQGLAKSITAGVTEVVNRYGRVIVLEDDIVTSPDFLRFMNEALDRYENEKDVYHISGWNYPIDPDGLPEVFLWRVMNCWGWATWADRWAHYEKDPNQLIGQFSQEDIRCFNLDGHHNFWKQVLMNQSGEINTWAIFWYASIFKKSGLCLGPTRSLVTNIGLDGSGIHCINENKENEKPIDKGPRLFPDLIQEDEQVLGRIKLHLKKESRLVKRVTRLLKRQLTHFSIN